METFQLNELLWEKFTVQTTHGTIKPKTNKASADTCIFVLLDWKLLSKRQLAFQLLTHSYLARGLYVCVRQEKFTKEKNMITRFMQTKRIPTSEHTIDVVVFFEFFCILGWSARPSSKPPIMSRHSLLLFLCYLLSNGNRVKRAKENTTTFIQ